MPDPHNHLLTRLAAPLRRRMLARCESVHLDLSVELGERGTTTTHVYFPVTSFVSLVAVVDKHPGLEVAMVGAEGMLGLHLALGVKRQPLRAVVQGEGTAWRMSAAHLHQEIATSPPLHKVLLVHAEALMAQLASASACVKFHEIAPRLARWLLMSQDRAQTPQLHMTHEFLSLMLGVRRVGVTVAASALQRRGLIHYHRGMVDILDRAGLEGAACSCYTADQDRHRLLAGGPPRPTV